MLPSPVPHPLDWPGLNVPGWARGLFESVLGVDWPEGDETKVWDLADLWYEVAAALDGPRDEAAIAAREVNIAFGGTTDLAHGFAAAFLAVADGDQAPLPSLLMLTDEIAKLVEECGCDIEAAKLEVWIELGVFVAELAALGIAMAFTAGAVTPAAGAAVAATRLAIAQILQGLVARLAQKVLRPGAEHAVEAGVQQAGKRGLGGLARRFGTAGPTGAAPEGTGAAIAGYQIGDGRRRGVDLGVAAPGGALVGVDPHAEGGAELFETIGRQAGGELLAENASSPTTTGDLADSGGAMAAGTRSGVTADALSDRLDRLGAEALADSRSADGPVVAGAAPPAANPPPPAGPAAGDPARAAVPSPQVSTGVPVQTPSRPDIPPPPRHDQPAPRHDQPAQRHESSPPRHDPPSSPAPRHDPPAVRYEAPEPVRRDSAPRHDQAPAPRAEAPSRADGPTVAGVAAPVRPDPVSLAPPAAGDVASPARPEPSPTTVSSDRATSASVTTPATTSTSAFAAGSGTSTATGGPGVPHSGSAGPGAVGSGGVGSGPAGSSAVGYGPAVAGPAGHGPAGTGTAPGSAGPSGPSGSMPSGTGPSANASSGAAAGQSPGAGVRSDGPGRAHPADQDGLDFGTDVDLAETDPTAVHRERPDAAPAADSTVVIMVPFVGLPSFPKTPQQCAGERELRGYGRYLTMLGRGLELTRTADTAAALARVIAGHQLSAATSRRWYDHHVARGEQGMADLWWQQHLTDSAKLDRARADQAALVAGDRIPGTVPVPDRTWATGDLDAGSLVEIPPPADAKTRPTAANTRPYGRRGGLRPPLKLHQADLYRVVPRNPDGTFARHPDPSAGWIRYANDGGAGADPTRGNNCIDCVAVLFSTWIGNPEVAAPRTYDAQDNGGVQRPVGGEVDGPARLETLTGGTFQAVLPDTAMLDPSVAADLRAKAFAELAAQLRAAGPGAFAALIGEAPDGRTHAWAAVNKDGTVHYADPQLGTTADQPLYPDVTRFDALVVNADGVSYPLADRDLGRWSAAALTAADLDALASLDPTNAVRRAASLQRDVVLSAEERRVLGALSDAAADARERVKADLRSACGAAAEALGLPRCPDLVGLRYAVRNFDSLAGEYDDEARGFALSADEFAESVDDALRFSISLPGDAHYGPSLIRILDWMRAAGYQVRDCESKNFWRTGNRFYGYDFPVVSPGGDAFRIGFPTDDSYRAGKVAHDSYEVLRREGGLAPGRVHAFLTVLAWNRRSGLVDAAPEVPHGVGSKDVTFANWLAKNRGLWAGYVRWLETNELTFGQVAAEYGLDSRDFPISADVARGLSEETRGILCSLP